MDDEIDRNGSYKIDLPESGKWTLHDLYKFPHSLEQCYSFIYCLDTELPARDRERIDYAFSAYPWRGGYSYVNIYQVLASQIPPRSRPKIISMHKASPGWIELLANLDAIEAIAKAIAVIAGSIATTTFAYSKTTKYLANLNNIRKEADVKDLQLTRLQITELNLLCKELADSLGFKSIDELHRRTQNPEVSLKLLAAHYRRMQILLEYVQKGKVLLPIEDTTNKQNQADA